MPFEHEKNIRFFFEGVKFTLRNRKELKQFLSFVFTSEGTRLDSINFIFSTDKALYNINEKFLGHDFFTDILTFSLAGKGDPVVADVYISVDRVRDNAMRQGEPFQRELHRVIFHGALHLCGYKDKSRSQTEEMRRKEDHYLAEYFGNVSRDTLPSK
jgi:rRNA maturation RNase YbeY